MFAATENPNDTSDQTLINLPFYPDIVVAEFKAAVRLYDSVTDPRVTQALKLSMIYVNDELADWKAIQETASYTKLADVPAETYDAESKLIHLYKVAVYSKAKAKTLENYTDADNTQQGDERAEAMENSADDYKQEAREAIRKIIGVSRVTVELI